ncbi:hypothetical protein ISN45_At05g023990 [Arabidopsis thaliana x Arabidopsis arenosa]|uniref:Uncharacterized protein n=1 Tax=Arabidopsis thaliana x Arabidopsis arenosa TaxID=1240361 RepID=A0A8T2D2Y9_9BRAS|nr:hypothetical protein ISN45_At05g023990 [Arabidopsis thaliana x Arabidopsis arenosa]
MFRRDRCEMRKCEHEVFELGYNFPLRPARVASRSHDMRRGRCMLDRAQCESRSAQRVYARQESCVEVGRSLSSCVALILYEFAKMPSTEMLCGAGVRLTLRMPLELSVSVVAEIRVQETNTRLVTLSHVDLPKRINDIEACGEIDIGRSELVIEEVWFADYFDHRELSFATIPLSVELGLEYARRDELARFVWEASLRSRKRSSAKMMCGLASDREGEFSEYGGLGRLMVGNGFDDLVVNNWDKGAHSEHETESTSRNCRIDELTVESRNSRVDGFQIGKRLTSRNGWINEKKCQIDEISVASRKIAGAVSNRVGLRELTIARTDIVVFYSACSSVDVRLVVTFQRIFTGVLVDGPNDDRSRPIASVHRSFHERSCLGGIVSSSLSFLVSCKSSRSRKNRMTSSRLVLRGVVSPSSAGAATGVAAGAATGAADGTATGAAAGTATGAAARTATGAAAGGGVVGQTGGGIVGQAGGGVVGRAGGGVVGRAGGAARGAMVLTPCSFEVSVISSWLSGITGNIVAARQYQKKTLPSPTVGANCLYRGCNNNY